uniref:Uncharacterized protein n=1 Tax=viral metagenome TaxID=1070528 RepID=A0A6C0KNT9_9ZZZZ
MSTNQELFMFDDCYARPTTILEASFNATLINSYNKFLTPNAYECEKKALRNNSDFFIINDVSSIGSAKYTNCYLPKSTNNGIISNALNIFDSTFGEPPYTKRPATEVIDSCSNFFYNNGANNPNKCFRYTVDNKVYAPKKYYAYYKKPLFNRTNITRASILPNPKVYKDKISELKTYEALIKFDSERYIDNGPLVFSFERYICNPEETNSALLDADIHSLKLKYKNLYHELDRISTDISSITYLNGFDDETLISLNVEIKKKTKELNSLLSFGGANNGRLSDTTFLTQFKIVESSVLLLIIISALFFYNKMRKVKLPILPKN